MKEVVRSRRKKGRESGSGMIELVFTIPVLLIVAGSTVDIARYMTYLQVTSFVSQEAGAQIYRECSDLTSYEKPNPAVNQRAGCPNDTRGNHPLCVDVAETTAAINLCVQLAQRRFQNVLNSALGSRGVVSSSVFRVNIREADTTADCLVNNQAQIQVTTISAKGTLNTTSPYNFAVPSPYGGTGYTPNPYDQNLINTAGIKISTGSSPAPGNPISGGTTTALETSQLQYNSDFGLQQIFPPTSGKETRTLIDPASMCSRGRIVAVEVAYAFEPAVKFLPHMMTKLDTNAINREITIF